jgi:hypothetical protein
VQVLYFRVLSVVGAVATGILGGLRSAILFFTSGALFCAYQSSQCLTMYRIVSACVVVSGVLVYSYGSKEPVKTPDDVKKPLPLPPRPGSRPSSQMGVPIASSVNRQSPFTFIEKPPLANPTPVRCTPSAL